MIVQPKPTPNDACLLFAQPEPHGPTMRAAVASWPLQLDVEPWRP